MAAIWRFHHESWAEPWSSDDFPADERKEEIEQRLLRLSLEPWWKNTRNEVVRFVHNELPNQWQWGFTIYHTIYTPEPSQDVFLEAISKNLYANIGPDLNEDEPSRIFKEGYRPLVFDDPAQFKGETLDRETLENIRQHFSAFRHSNYAPQGIRSGWCIVIEDSLQSVIRHPEPQEGDGKGGWVTILEPDIPEGSWENPEYYQGYLRFYLNDLWDLTRIGDVFNWIMWQNGYL